jgi:hypothetical protein
MSNPVMAEIERPQEASRWLDDYMIKTTGLGAE